MTPVGPVSPRQPQLQRCGNQGCCARPISPVVAAIGAEDRVTQIGPDGRAPEKPERASPPDGYMRIRAATCHERTEVTFCHCARVLVARRG